MTTSLSFPLARLLRLSVARVTDPYVLTCTCLILLWLVTWLISFQNIYGWLTDDIYQFSRVMQYEQGGRNLLDIQWFHAFDWLIVLLPWKLHWVVPSHMIPQAWSHTGEFRALILYVIFLHAALLGMIAYFLRALCSNKWICVGALVLFMTSPTFVFYSDLIDSRYLGLIAGIPALVLLLLQYPSMGAPASLVRLLYGFALPGFLIGVGQSIHYTLMYFAGPIALIYWCYVFRQHSFRGVWLQLLFFFFGILAWFVPVQLLSLNFHPFNQSMIGIMLNQVHVLSSHYDKIADSFTWMHFFVEDMGIPMMISVVAGAIILFRDATRPPYVSRFHAQLMLWSTLLAMVYLLITPSIAFYRQVSAYQIFYMLFALVAIDTCVRAVRGLPKAARSMLAGALFIAVAFVPSMVRMPEVFVASQGLGRAVNFAHKLTRENRVYFIEFYDFDIHPQSIVARQDFSLLRPGDYIITDFPTLYYVKYPDIFALLHDTKPVASFPTEWCTTENWVEERTYWDFRRYQAEPESCNAQVYSVSDIRKQQMGKLLEIASMRADSSLSVQQEPWRVFALRQPRVPLDIYGLGLCCNRGRIFEDLWASKQTADPHWLEITFRHPTKIQAVTVVPTNYLAPPDFSKVGRPAATQIFGWPTLAQRPRLLWTGKGLRDSAIYSSAFAPVTVAKLRFVITAPEPDSLDHAIITQQRLPASAVAGIEYVRFPGYVVRLDSRVPRDVRSGR